MAKTRTNDGWHDIAGYRVFVDNGKVVRGISSDGQRTLYPYRFSSKYKCWINETTMSVDAFKAGVRRETVQMM